MRRFERAQSAIAAWSPYHAAAVDARLAGDRPVILFALAHSASAASDRAGPDGTRLAGDNPVSPLARAISASGAAVMGILISIEEPTRGMIEAANHSGTFVHPLTGHSYPKVQLLTVGQLLADTRPNMPQPYLPYIQAERFAPDHPTLF